MKFPVEPKDRFYCVYHLGFDMFSSKSLSACLRYIAKQLPGGRTARVTDKQAVEYGFRIRAV